MSSNKKILLVSNGFYPEISPRSYRATELAKEFIRKGCEVTVITKFRNYDYKDFLSLHPLKLKMWSQSRLLHIPEFRTKLLNLPARVITRLLQILMEYPAIEDMFHVKKMLDRENLYDLMISFAVPYPVQWGTAWSKSGKHPIAETWIADCSDPYMGDVLDTFRKPFYFGYLEKWFCRKADFIAIPVETALQGYYKEFHEKIRIIPQGFDFVLPVKSVSASHEVPEFAYAGSFMTGIRDPGKLMECLTGLPISFRFHVYTSQADLFNSYKDRLNGKLVLHPFIPREKLLNELAGMDFLINFDNNTTRNVPSKLIDYAITGKPVLNIDKDFSDDLLKEFLARDYSRKMQLPDPEKFLISNIADKFLTL
jgi:hypothetical protein